MLLYKQQPVSGGPGTYPGGRPRAWEILLMYWAFGAAAGSLGYWDLLFSSIKAPPALQSSTGVYTLLGAVAAIAFLRLPLYLGAFRMGRPLSKLSLVIFPLCNALFEGFVLLFIFDAGRWMLADKDWNVQHGSIGVAALRDIPTDSRRFWREFLVGLVPYTIFYISAYALVWEDHVLPVHLDLDTPNKFVKAMVMEQFAMSAVYWLFGDVASFVLLRWVSNLLLVLSVRMPPPGAGLAPVIHPDDVAGGAAGASQQTGGAGKPVKSRKGSKKNKDA